MKLAVFAIFSLLLTACSNAPHAPQTFEFNGKTYVQVTHNQINDMQQMLYLPQTSNKNPDDWQQGLLVFFDKNHKNLTLAQRITLRKAAYAKQRNTLADIRQTDNELRSEVFYPPTGRFTDYQLEVTRGRNLYCGYAQIQYSEKYPQAHTDWQKTLKMQPLVKQQLANLALIFNRYTWQLTC